MSQNVIIIDKKPGQTPLESLNEVKNAHPEWKHVPMTYAGRLDPLASGVLLILVGDECLKKDEYLALPKEYEATLLFGFATDTYDVMGKVETSPQPSPYQGEGEPTLDSVHAALKNFTGRFAQTYPPYSSRTVDGKPLFVWAREGKLDEITIPSHDVFVERIDVVDSDAISGTGLYTYIKDAISAVSGDFRQAEILHEWAEILGTMNDVEFKTVTLRISCSSGVYVRSIAHELGVALGIPALALKIVRTKIGDYTV